VWQPDLQLKASALLVLTDTVEWNMCLHASMIAQENARNGNTGAAFQAYALKSAWILAFQAMFLIAQSPCGIPKPRQRYLF
jgi:hypothetical protein